MKLIVEFEVGTVNKKSFYDDKHIKHEYYEMELRDSAELVTLTPELGELLFDRAHSGDNTDIVTEIVNPYVDGKRKRTKLTVFGNAIRSNKGVTDCVRFE